MAGPSKTAAAAPRRELSLILNLLNVGYFSAAWLHRDCDPLGFVKPAHYVALARAAEAARFDAVFMADRPVLAQNPPLRPFQSLEPLAVLGAVAAVTTHIGLIGTASTSFNTPYDLARRFATLDLISGGRGGWNMVTTSDSAAALNFGLTELPDHPARYGRAAEFAQAVGALWGSWAPDAVIGDKLTGRLVDPEAVSEVEIRGEHIRLKGRFNAPRSPQGRPVLVQAGASEEGRGFAARSADVIFALSRSLEEGLAFAADLRGRAAALGRDPAHLRILPGVVTVLGGTEAEARARLDELTESLPLDDGLVRLADTLGVPPETLELDGPLPEGLPIPRTGNVTMFKAAVGLARRENLTVRQLIRRFGGGGGHRILVGTPEQIADDLVEWLDAGAADGFNLMPDLLPTGFEAFAAEVVPILRRKGVFRSDYEGTRLRDHLRLPIDPPARGLSERKAISG